MVSLDDIFGNDEDDGYGEGGYGEGEYGGEDVSEEEKCGLIIDIASEKAMERCGDEAVKAQISQMFGVDFSEIKCGQILENDPDETDILSAKQYAACRAIELSDEYCLRRAINMAWDEVESDG